MITSIVNAAARQLGCLIVTFWLVVLAVLFLSCLRVAGQQPLPTGVVKDKLASKETITFKGGKTADPAPPPAPCRCPQPPAEPINPCSDPWAALFQQVSHWGHVSLAHFLVTAGIAAGGICQLVLAFRSNKR